MKSVVDRRLRLLAACVLGAACLHASGASADDRLVRHFGTGDNSASVGISVSEPGPDKVEEGPQALATGDDGTLFLLDQVNGRILSFNPNEPTAPTQSYTLPPDVQPTDLVVKGSDIYVWDGTVHALKAIGADSAPVRGLTTTRSLEGPDAATQTAFAQMGSVDHDEDAPGVSTRGIKTNRRNDLAKQMVDTRGRGPVVATVTLDDKGAGAVLDVRSKDGTSVAAKLQLRVHDRLGTIAFLDIDRSGHMYVLAENIPTDIHDAAFVFVARYTPKGVLEGNYEVPLSSTSMSRRCVTVSRDGDVYFLKTLKKSIDIIGLGFRTTPNAKVVEFARAKPNIAATAWVQTTGVNIAAGPLTRERIIQAALGYEGIQWTVTPPAYGTQQACSGFNGRIRVPMYMIGKEGETVRGVPYCWGCQGSVRQFMSRIQGGTMAGNVCTKDGVRNDVAGVDCSSFVSATWGLSTHFTTAVIPAIANQLSNPWDMLPGDALDKPGSHVVLFMGFTPNREALVMEASPGACKGRVCRNTYPISWLLSRGFIPVRYKALAASTAAATP